MYIFIALSSFIFSILFSFGCTPQGDGILGSQNSVTTQVDLKVKQAPFPYDIVADTISYNSCVYKTVLASAQTGIPALKIGASEGFVDKTGSGAVRSGLKLKTTFLQYIGQNFKPSFPATSISPQQVRSVLEQADSATDTYLQYSIRYKASLNVHIDLISPSTPELQIPFVGRDIQLFRNELNTSYLAHQMTKDIKYKTDGTILSENSRIYNLSSSSEAVPIESTFKLNQTIDESFPGDTESPTVKESGYGAAEAYADSIRQKFNSTGLDKILLTAVFAGDNADSATPTSNTVSVLRRPTGAAAHLAYGRGYSLNFQSKSTSAKAGWIKNILSGVNEIDLTTGSEVIGAPWECKNFVIVKSNHWNNKRFKQPTCSPFISSDLTAARQDDIRLIRRHYSKASWNVGLFIPATSEPSAGRSHLEICIAPIDLSCYLPTTGVLDGDSTNTQDIGINFDPEKECYLTAYNNLGVVYTAAGTGTPDGKRLLGRCAQYASICKRNGINY